MREGHQRKHWQAVRRACYRPPVKNTDRYAERMVAKTTAIFLVAVLAELGGVYAIWRWRRVGASIWLVPIGLSALLAYAVVQTYQPETSFGRLYAAYAGVFLLGAMLWGWVLDGLRPDRFDSIGAILVVAGITIILWGRVLFN